MTTKAKEKSYKPNVVLAQNKYKVVGTRPIRSDGYERVTGRARFAGDIKLPGTLYAKVLRSPHAHANIKSIDTRAAEKLPGVRAVVTAKDFHIPPQQVNKVEMFSPPSYSPRENMLAYKKAYYVGHAVAAVAADDANIAEEACKLIKVDYEVLPFVLTALDGMKKDAPILFKDLTTKNMGSDTGKVSNVSNYMGYTTGDVKKGFKEADVIMEREFYTSTVHQGYIEPQTSLGLWERDDRVYLWTATQGNFPARDLVANILGLPIGSVKFIPTEIGGGFGGKLAVYLEPIVALLSKKAGNRPVKAVMTRKEVIEATGPAPGTYVKVKIGAKKNGKITAGESWMAYELGSFPGTSALSHGVVIVFAAYDIANVKIDGYDVVVNKPKAQALRAPGATQVVYASEQVVDDLARAIGMDPVEFRLKNAAQEGTRRHDGVVYPKIGFKEVLEAAKAHPHYKAPLQRKGPDGKLRGRGIASALWTNAGATSSATLTVQYDGSISLMTGSVDLAGSKTALAMQAAEALGLPLDVIHPTVGDTDSVGWTHYSGGSRTVYATGIAVYDAAQKMLAELKDRVARIWDVPVAKVHYKEGVFTSKSDSKLRMTFGDLGKLLENTGGTITASATVDPLGYGAALGTHMADVEVDPETGKVDILRYTVLQDAGKAVHPSYVEGQMQGGAVQGAGWALSEEYFYDKDGRVSNSSLLDYRMPTSLDMPMIDTVIVEVANPGHPYGVRGVGENNIIAPAAALANAIYDAVGVRVTRLPMKPGEVLLALAQKGKSKGK